MASAAPTAAIDAPLTDWRMALAAVALCALTVVAYGPAYRAGFVWDDDDYVSENAALDDLGGLARIWLSPGAVPQYYPLTFTSFWLEHHVFGDAPTGYHVVNVLLHALNAILAWLVLRRLRVPGAWLAAAIFAVHPVHVESVAWITERKNLLSGTCYLAALLAAFGRSHGAPRPAFDALVLALFAAALLAKTVTCSLPVVLLLAWWWQRGRLTAEDVRSTLPLFALGITLALVTIWMERTHVGARGELWDLSSVERVLIAGRALWFYVASLVWPYPLSFVYGRWTVDTAVWWQWLFPLAAVATGIGLWLARARIGRAPFAAAAGFAVTLAPALGFVDVYPMRYTFVADHYQYLASLFLIAPLAALVTAGARRITPAQPALATVPVVLLLAVLTWRHARIFTDQETLWHDVIAKDPSGSMAYINLGMWLQQQSRSPEALAALEAAARLEPDDAEVHGDLGIVLATLGRGAAALTELETALRLAPDSAPAHSNLANALAGAGRLDEAADHYREAVRLDPEFADAHNNLANVLVQQHAVEEAIDHYRAAIVTDPTYIAARYNLATVLAGLGRNEEAIAQLREVVGRDPSHADAQRMLGVQLAGRGQWPEAIDRLGAAARLRPQDFAIRHELATALAASGRFDDAIVAYSRALELRPDDPDLHNDLGIAFARRGDRTAAAGEFRKALALAPEHGEARNNLAALAEGAPP